MSCPQELPKSDAGASPSTTPPMPSVITLSDSSQTSTVLPDTQELQESPSLSSEENTSVPNPSQLILMPSGRHTSRDTSSSQASSLSQASNSSSEAERTLSRERARRIRLSPIAERCEQCSMMFSNPAAANLYCYRMHRRILPPFVRASQLPTHVPVVPQSVLVGLTPTSRHGMETLMRYLLTSSSEVTGLSVRSTTMPNGRSQLEAVLDLTFSLTNGRLMRSVSSRHQSMRGRSISSLIQRAILANPTFATISAVTFLEPWSSIRVALLIWRTSSSSRRESYYSTVRVMSDMQMSLGDFWRTSRTDASCQLSIPGRSRVSAPATSWSLPTTRTFGFDQEEPLMRQGSPS